MATVQCKMCGGVVDISSGVTYAECPYCGSATTFPKLTDGRKESLYNRAEQLRQSNQFDKALETYEKILEIDDSDPEIYWGMVLCRYGIEYVEDPLSHERIPTCHRVQFESILDDSDYKAALQYANGYDAAYETEANRIAEIQKGILAISSQEPPYDVFICYKETTDGGTRTKDSTVAQDIYYQLTNDGFRVFFARITLEEKLGQQYEPYIFAALNSAKVMLVIGSKKEYFEAVWVKNEWSRFLRIMKNDRSKMLIPCYKDMDAYDIPQELSRFQSQDMSKIGFLQDLLRGIKKVLESSEESSKKSNITVNNSVSVKVVKKTNQRNNDYDDESEDDSPQYELYSPTAIVWTTVFCPIIALWGVWKNYEILGEEKQASKAQLFFWLFIIIYVIVALVGRVWMCTILLLFWYFTEAAKQTRYLKENNISYTPRPVLIKCLVLSAVITVFVIFAAICENITC